MTRVHAIASIALFAVACVSGDGSAPDSSRADVASDGALRCVVVEVLDDNVLEEGLGSIYDYDDEGFPRVDGDSLEVSVRTSDQSEIESKLIMDVGQLTIGFDAADTITRADSVDDTIQWDGESDGLHVRVRVFADSHLGFVDTIEGDSTAPLAKIDCRAGVSVPDSFL